MELCLFKASVRKVPCCKQENEAPKQKQIGVVGCNTILYLNELIRILNTES